MTAKIAVVTWTLIVFALPVYAFYTRGAAVTFKYTAVPMCLLFIGQFVMTKPVFRGRIGDILGFAFISFFVSLIIYGAGVALLDGYAKMPRGPGFWTLCGIGAGTLCIGIACFWLRSTQRVLWGVTEIGVGIALPVYKAGEMSLQVLDPNFAIFALTAGIYLVVRGMDNVSQGKKDAKKTVGLFR